MLAKKVTKNSSFDEIMAQTSIVGALEKNKVAYVKLNNYVKTLDDKLVENMLKIDQENRMNRQFIYNLDREMKKNSKTFRKKQELDSKPKPLDEKQRRFNDKNLPELMTNETPFIKHIQFKSIDSGNYFLPALIQNLQRQQHYSHLNLKELVDTNKAKAHASNYKRNQLLKNRTLATAISLEDSNTGSQNHFGDHHHHQDASTLHQSSALPMLLKNEQTTDDNNNKPAESSQQEQQVPDTNNRGVFAKTRGVETAMSKLTNTRQATKVPKDNLEAIRSIRRERTNPREINEFYESKMNLLKIARRFDQYRSKCTKKCEYKHATFLNTHNNQHVVRSYDDEEDFY